MELQKAYGALYRERCLDILLGYGVGPRALKFICTYWGQITILDKARGYYEHPFKGYCGTTQGCLFPPRY